MRRILICVVLGLAGLTSSASAGERIFADGFEPCCTLGGEVTGLSGSGLVLHLAAGVVSESKPISANGGQPVLYTFAHIVPTGTNYAVNITTQPAGQTCTLTNASGSVGGSHVFDINVSCRVDLVDLIWDQGSWDNADWQ